jgi:hypothetical protein
VLERCGGRRNRDNLPAHDDIAVRVAFESVAILTQHGVDTHPADLVDRIVDGPLRGVQCAGDVDG